MAADPDSRPVYVMEQGAVVAVRRGRLEVFKERETLGTYRLIDVSQVCLFGNVTVTPQVMREMFAREIPVCWFSYGGWFSGMAEGLPGKHVDLRRAQYNVTRPPAGRRRTHDRGVHGGDGCAGGVRLPGLLGRAP